MNRYICEGEPKGEWREANESYEGRQLQAMKFVNVGTKGLFTSWTMKLSQGLVKFVIGS